MPTTTNTNTTTQTKSPTPLDTSTFPTSSLSQDPSSASATSPHSEADFRRAMSHTEAWKPAFNRSQSWSKEEYKHAMQISALMGGNGDGKTAQQGEGFK